MPTIEINHVDYFKDPDDENQSTLFTNAGYDGGDDYSYIVLRSVNMANPDGLYSEAFQHDYRLMCFEFQDYYTANIEYGSYLGPVGSSFKIKTVFNDTSMDIVHAITQSYWNMLDGDLKEYLNEAQDKCSYNNIEEYFNTYFVTEMNNRYAADPSAAPWNLAPILYNMHRDLLYDEFRGDKEEMLLNAQRIVAQISPDTGTLASLKQFMDQFENLWTAYYAGPTGLVWKAIEATDVRPDTLESGTTKQLKYWQDYGNLPDIHVSDEAFVYHVSGVTYKYYKMSYEESANLSGTTKETTKELFKEYIFDLWEEVLWNCEGCAWCKAPTITGTDYVHLDGQFDLDQMNVAAVLWAAHHNANDPDAPTEYFEKTTVYLLLKNLGQDKTWAEYYNNIEDKRQSKNYLTDEQWKTFKKLAQWLWSTDVSRETMNLSTQRDPGSGFDWKSEITERYGRYNLNTQEYKYPTGIDCENDDTSYQAF